MRKSAEVVVVGGGIIGCATAAELAAEGADVVLIERREIAHGASGRNHGLIFYPQNPVTDPLYRASQVMYRELAAAQPLNIAMDELPRGFIVLVAHKDEWAAAEVEAEACRAGGVRVEKLDETQLRQAEPYVAAGLLGGWLIEDGYRLDPAALTLAFALTAAESGAEIVTNTDVKQILVDGERVAGVATDRGVIRATTVVDAAGPWAPKLARSLGFDLPVIGARGWLLLSRAIEPVCNHLLESSGWHLLAGDPGPVETSVGDYGEGQPPRAPDVGMLIQQNQTGHVLMGGSRLATLIEEPEGIEVTREIAGRAARTLPRLAEAPLAAVWSGVRPMTPDGLPLIGWLPGVEGFFVATGHGGQGIIQGGGTGRLAAQMILEKQPFTDPAPFRAQRGLSAAKEPPIT